jgi:hypothetical protein
MNNAPVPLSDHFVSEFRSLAHELRTMAQTASMANVQVALLKSAGRFDAARAHQDHGARPWQ